MYVNETHSTMRSPTWLLLFSSVPALRKMGTFFALKGDNYFINSPLNWEYVCLPAHFHNQSE